MAVGRNSIEHVRHKQDKNTHGIDFSVYSINAAPTQIVSHFPPSDYLQTTHANCLLPEPETEHARMADGTVLVGVGKMGFSNERLFSHSFASCTPIVVFYPDGNMALYHASSAATDDEKRNELLSRRPADLFVITKAGEGRHLLRQSAQAISIIENAPAGCNVHIVEVPRSVLAVEVFPGTLDIYQMSN